MKIGFTEVLLVFIVALVVIGPERLPYYARKLGEALSEFRHISSAATSEIRESVIEPLNEAQKPIKDAIDDIDKGLRAEVDALRDAIEDTGKDKT